jgi:isoleucyl-tRNA synthetase
MHIAESLVRWIAPILSFTSEEIWQLLPGERESSVFLSNWHQFPSSDSDEEWQTVQGLNETVAKSLEVARDKEVIGSSLDADLTLYVDEKLMDFLNPLSEELRFLFITSNLSIAPLNKANKDVLHGDNCAVSVKKSEFNKCNRCWHRQEGVGDSEKHPELCPRCENNISNQSEQRQFF